MERRFEVAQERLPQILVAFARHRGQRGEAAVLEISISEVRLAFEKAGFGTAAKDDSREKEHDHRLRPDSERSVGCHTP
jgi:hypothetical protein